MGQLSKKTLSEQIYDILRAEILSQALPCGEKLTIRQLMERFGTSSTPVRDAMSLLAQEGLLDQVSNAGARVVVLSEQDVREIYGLCAVLDAAAMESAASGEHAAAFSGALQDSIRSQEAALAVGDLPTYRMHSDCFHDLFYAYADNRRLMASAIRIRGQLSILTNRYQNLQRSTDIILSEHREMARLISEHAIDEAVMLLRAHIRHGMLFLLEGLHG